MKLLRYLLYLLLLLAALTTNAQNDLYKTRRLSAVNGLPSNTIRTIVQDSNGFIWVGGTAGLSRFDGYRFVNFNGYSANPNQNQTHHISKLILDKENNLLWLASNTFKYSCIDLHKDRFVSMNLKEGEDSVPYSNRYMSSNGLWIYNKTSGIRHITYKDGKIECNDLTKGNHKLPSNNIHNIFEDANQNIWIATDNGIVKFDSVHGSKTFLAGHDIICSNIYAGNILAFDKNTQTAWVLSAEGRPRKKVTLSSAMGYLDKGRKDIVWNSKWILFTKEKTYCLDLTHGIYSTDEEYQIPNASLQGMDNGYIFVANKSGYLWVFPPMGDVKKIFINPNAPFSNDRNGIYQFDHDKNGLFYIASYGSGLFTLDPKTWQTHQYTAEDEDPLIYSNYLLDVMVDSSDCIWISTEGAGISLITPFGGSSTKIYIPDPTKKGDWSNYVRLIYKGKDGNIYCNTRNNKVYTYNPGNGFHLVKESKASTYGYLLDSKGHEWVATRGDGLYVDGVHYSSKDSIHHVPIDDFFDVVEDKFGRIWLASWGAGLLMTEYKEGAPLKFKTYLNNEYNESRIHDLETSHYGDLWIATYNGLYYINVSKRNFTEKDFLKYNVRNGKFPNDEVICLKKTDDLTVWAGVTGCGLLKCDFSRGAENMTYREISTNEGLSNNNVKTIVQDKYGYVWASTEEGLSRINKKDNSVNKYTASPNIQSNFFSENSAYVTDKGTILFGTGYGIAEINPSDDEHHRKSLQPLPARITDITINGSSIYENNQDSLLLSQSLCTTQSIDFEHIQNSLTIYYSNFNYREIESQLYSYYLEGEDETWCKVTSDNKADYSNLSPGHYTFHVKTFRNNMWSKETTLEIIINQPWYNTWWAWMLYLLFLGGAIWFIYHSIRVQIALDREVQVEKELTEFRLNFFTNITHEFRTPLAIIQNAINKLSQSENAKSRQDVQTAARGTKRLLRLVNQLMEFRKINTGNEKLQVTRGDIIEFIREIYLDLWSLSKQKALSITYTPFEKHFEMLFDHEMIETIVYNLISNAIKYTPERGTVNIRVAHDAETKNLTITVEDSGNGISEEQLQALFSPFMKGKASRGGMGIGLYTAHKAAELHHGKLTYKRLTEQGGSLFTVTLPTNDSVYSEDEFQKTTVFDTTQQSIKESEEIIQVMKPEALNNQKVVIIEDDPDMMQQIKDEISIYFQTLCYMTGETGLKGIRENHPDLILCDVMLPDTDGYEIVSTLKKEANYTNIPVIMLTALDDETHQIKGYQAGADDYMVKPCNFKLLIARMIQLMKWSNKHIATPQEESTIQDPAPIQQPVVITVVQDKKFKDQVDNLIALHLDDSNFSVDTLASAMKMGRTKFYGKMKDLYGISPNKYIMNIRMEKAVELIQQGDLTISEIGYKVGIPDASYFNKCFKQKYGVAPSKFKQ